MEATDRTAEAVGRAYFDAVNIGDTASVERLLSPTVQYHFPGRSPLAGTYVGPAAVGGYIQRLGEYTSGTLAVDVTEILSGGDFVVGLVSVSATHAQSSLTWPLAIIMRVQKGAIDEIWLHYHDLYAVDEFLAEA